MASRKKQALDPYVIRQLVGETLVEERAILRWWRGETVRPATKKALDDAAKRIGVQR
jgi:hypothetical protein